VIAAPPFEAGTVHDAASCPSEGVNANAVGAPGAAAAVAVAVDDGAVLNADG
jgi:hypothetical protein